MRCGAFLEKKRERIWAMPVFWFSWSLTARLHRRKLPGVRHRQASPSARWSRSGVFLEKQEHHFQEGYPKLLLSCASMGAERYEEALEVLKEVVYKKEK